jgi:hypothetical protein
MTMAARPAGPAISIVRAGTVYPPQRRAVR